MRATAAAVRLPTKTFMSRTPKQPPVDGILVIDKPSGKTSHDVVESVRQLAGFRGIGHLGTLDPQATGVLVLALGRATRLARFYTGRRKRYTFAARFLGKIQQAPPAYSAKKIHGRPAHELARKNKPVKLEPVEVEVFEFRLTGVEGSIARFVVECGAGTYVRSLAHELGRLQRSGAHLAEITRTAVGEFTLDQAVSLLELGGDARAGRLLERVIPLEKLLTDLPRTTILPVIEKRVRHGAKFNLTLAQIQPGQTTVAQNAPLQLDSGDWKPARLRVFSQQGQLIAIAEPVVPRTYQPVVVLEAAP